MHRAGTCLLENDHSAAYRPCPAMEEESPHAHSKLPLLEKVGTLE